MTRPGIPDRPDRHLRPIMVVRPDPEARSAAAAILAANGWTMSDFVDASLVLLTRNPGPYLARLEAFRPPARKGRPKSH